MMQSFMGVEGFEANFVLKLSGLVQTDVQNVCLTDGLSQRVDLLLMI